MSENDVGRTSRTISSLAGSYMDPSSFDLKPN